MKPKTPVMRVFSVRLTMARKAKGFSSAQEFAHFIGIEPHRYRTYEAGKSEPPFEILVHICRSLGVTPNDLLSFEGARTGSGRSSTAPQTAPH